MNVFLRELRANRRSTITWTVSLCSILGIFMGMYPAFSGQVDSLYEVLENFPEAIRAAVNIQAETFLSVLGFYSYLLNFVVLAASIQAMNLGVGMISKETTGKTADFLLTKPVRRTGVMTAKLAAALTMLLITNTVFIAASYLAVASVDEPFSATALVLMALTMLLSQLFFLGLGVLFSVTIPKIKSVVAVSLPTVFAFYIIGAIGDVLENVEVRWASPFRYYDYIHIIKTTSYETTYLVLGLAFAAVSIVASYVVFVKKDVHTAV